MPDLVKISQSCATHRTFSTDAGCSHWHFGNAWAVAAPTIFIEKDSAGSLRLLIQCLGLVCWTGGQRKGAGLMPTHSYRGGTERGKRTGFSTPFLETGLCLIIIITRRALF